MCGTAAVSQAVCQQVVSELLLGLRSPIKRSLESLETPIFPCSTSVLPPRFWSHPAVDNVVVVVVFLFQGYRITANEWDAFPMDHLHLPGAVFATTFRYGACRPFLILHVFPKTVSCTTVYLGSVLLTFRRCSCFSSRSEDSPLPNPVLNRNVAQYPPRMSRHPVDRWYSQYRFEHVEHRDGSKADKPSIPFNQ